MKITKLTAILFVILSLAMVLALVGCQGGNGEGNETEIETSIQDVCNHNDTFVNSRCEEICSDAKIMSTGVHADLTVNARCQEVCSRCGEVFRSDVHGECVVNDACEKVCIDCGKVVETGVHGDKTDGKIKTQHVYPIGCVIDERIMAGAQYGATFSVLNKYLRHPELLELPPEKVLFDGVDFSLKEKYKDKM